MIRVTFCAYDGPGQINGPNAWLRRMLPALRAREIDAGVLFLLTAPAEQCPTLRALEAAGVPCRSARLHSSTGERVRWLLRMLQAAPPDVFVPNVVVPAYYAARWARQAGIPTVGILHSDDAFHHALIERFVRGAEADQLTAVVAVSQALAALVQQVTASTHVRRIPYGVPVPTTVAQPPADRLRLIYVGRLVEEQKRASDVARAICRAAGAISGVEGIIYGAGHAQPAIERVLAEEGAGLPVRLGGSLAPEAVQHVMSEAHALVLLSDYEGLPIALMEAMACGLVPICTPMRSGIGELVSEGENGLIVADRGEAFVRAVRRLRDEPGMWQCLSAAARETIRQGYGDSVAVESWVALFKELAQQPGPRIIRMPRRLALPPAHPAFAREDHRGPPLLAEALRYGRYTAGELRRRVLKRLGLVA